MNLPKDNKTLNTLNSLKMAFIVLVALISIGTIGFSLIQKWSILDSFYMTVISITTVGYEIPGKLNIYGKIFTCLYLLGSVVIFLYLGSEFVKNIININFNHFLSRKQMDNRIKNMKDHYIVSGFGRTGSAIAKQLCAEKVQFLVIEKDTEIAKDCVALGYPTINGDSTSEFVLEEAGISNAKGLFGCLNEDSETLFLSIAAKGINPDINIVARCSKVGNEEKFKRVGVNNVISPFAISGLRMVSQVLRPLVADFLEEAMNTNLGLQLRMEQFHLPPTSLLCGKSILDSDIRPLSGTYILAIKRDEQFIHNPTADTVLEPDDYLIVLGSTDQLMKFEEIIKQKGSKVI